MTLPASWKHLAITLGFILLIVISSVVVGAQWAGDTLGWYIGSAIGRLVSVVILLGVLLRLGWLRSAGFASPGDWKTWLLSLVCLVYSVAVSMTAFTDNFNLSVPDPALAGFASLFITSHACLEEVAFRGLVLHSLARAWGSAGRGNLKSGLISAVFFGGMHLFYILGEPLPVVLPRMLVAFLLGIIFAALVLRGRSIYPAAFFHGVLNLAGYLNLTSNAAVGTPSAWLVLGLLLFPLSVYGLYLLREISQFDINHAVF
jgi:membrane protease YdiL (CAAX protease family)